MPPSAQRQFLVKAAGITGYFATKTGGDVSADTSEVWDGGSLTPESMSSPPRCSNVIVGRPWKPERDARMVKRLRSRVGRERSTLSVTPTDGDLIALSDGDEVYPQALLVRATGVNVDASSGEPTRFELEWKIDSWE